VSTTNASTSDTTPADANQADGVTQVNSTNSGALEATNRIVVHDAVSIGSVVCERYEVSALLGVNEFGRVYQALDTKTWRSVSLCKVQTGLFSNRSDSLSFAGLLGKGDAKLAEDESTSEDLADRSDPNDTLFASIEALTAKDCIYLVQHEVTGPSLSGRLEGASRSQRTMTESDTRELFFELGRGILSSSTTKSHGIISPDRVFFNQGGIRIADQGIVSALPLRLRKKLLSKSSNSFYYDSNIYTKDTDECADYYSFGKIVEYVIQSAHLEDNIHRDSGRSVFRSEVLAFVDDMTSSDRQSREPALRRFLDWLEQEPVSKGQTASTDIPDGHGNIALTGTGATVGDDASDVLVGSRVFSEQTTPDYSAKDWHKRWERIDREYTEEDSPTREFAQNGEGVSNDTAHFPEENSGTREGSSGDTVKTMINSGSVTSTSGMLDVDSAAQYRYDSSLGHQPSATFDRVTSMADSSNSISPREARRKRRRYSAEVTQKKELGALNDHSRDLDSQKRKRSSSNSNVRDHRASGEIQGVADEIARVRDAAPVEVSIGTEAPRSQGSILSDEFTPGSLSLESYSQGGSYGDRSHHTQVLRGRSQHGRSEFLTWAQHNWRLVLVSTLLVIVSAIAIWALLELSRSPESLPVFSSEIR